MSNDELACAGVSMCEECERLGDAHYDGCVTGESARAVHGYLLGRFGKGDALALLAEAQGPAPSHVLAIGRDEGWIDDDGDLTEAFRSLIRSKLEETS